MKPQRVDKPNYYGIIPASVRYDKVVPPCARLLYSELSALTNKDGYCWASNAYFAKLYQVAPTTISAWINKLKERGHIRIENLDGVHRKIYLSEVFVNKGFNPSEKSEGTEGIEKAEDTLHNLPIDPSEKAEHNTTSNTTSNTTYSEDTDSYKLASYLFKKISERNPGHKQPNMQQWCRHIDLMLRIDKRDKVEIAEVIKWCQQDSFWQNNILSTAKLREKYDQLNIKRKTPSQIKGSNLGQIDKAKYQRLADNPPKY
jgi:hypothetical protein